MRSFSCGKPNSAAENVQSCLLTERDVRTTHHIAEFHISWSTCMVKVTPAYGFAARRPLALLVLLVAIAAGLTIALWLLPLGLLAYGAVVFLLSHDTEVVALAQRPSRPRLSSQTFRGQLDAIERTQQEIGRSVEQASGALGRLLLPIGDQARELMSEAYTLCDKGQII